MELTDEYSNVMHVDRSTAFPMVYSIYLEQFIDIFIEESINAGIRPEVAFSFSMIDTDFIRFKKDGEILITDNVFIKTNNISGKAIKYDDFRTGIRAEVQYTACLASDEVLKQKLLIRNGVKSLEPLRKIFLITSVYGMV